MNEKKKYDEAKNQQKAQILQEPAVAYGNVNYFALSNHLISKKYIKNVLDISKLTLSELLEIIPISIDTYKRKNEFNTFVTEKVLEIEEVYRRGLDAFGEGFYDWMDATNLAMGGLRPKELLRNSFGVRKLLDQIGRVEHGILA